MEEITVQELKQMQESGEDFQLIDVREPNEYEAANLGAELIPLGDILNHVEEIDRNKKVIIHCRSGARSARAIQLLEEQEDFDNLYNLKGGILAYHEAFGND
jgi:sulfur-carrier protein adenylyltransferase/sulfurtransferase